MRQTLHETIQLRVPAGFKAAVAEIAAREHLTPSCYLKKFQAGQASQPTAALTSVVGLNATAGLNEMIYGAAGAPVDFAARGTAGLIQMANKAFGTDIPEPSLDLPGDSRSIARTFGAVGVPDPATIEADTAAERIARGAGQGIGMTIAPEAAVAGLTRAGVGAGSRLMDYAGAVFGRGASAPAVAGNVVAGGASGAGAAAAGELTDGPWEPLAELAGGLVGGGSARPSRAFRAAWRRSGARRAITSIR